MLTNSTTIASEARYRYRLAVGHLARAERLLALGDWVGAVHFAQMAAENFTKARALCEALALTLSSLLEELLGVRVVEDPELYSIENIGIP